MKRMLAVLILLALPVAAQEQKKAEEAQTVKPVPGGVQRLFILKYADPTDIGQLIKVFTSSVQPNPGMHALAVTAPASAMAAIEDAIKRLDVPGSAPQSLEITAYFLVASTDPAQSVIAEPTQEPPKELEPVMSQLSSAFAYKRYRLFETLNARARTGRPISTSSTGASVKVKALNDQARPLQTDVAIQSTGVSGDGRVRLEGLRVSQRATDSPREYSFSINTNVDLKEGQKVVVGKSGINSNEAIFLVLTAHLVQ